MNAHSINWDPHCFVFVHIFRCKSNATDCDKLVEGCTLVNLNFPSLYFAFSRPIQKVNYDLFLNEALLIFLQSNLDTLVLRVGGRCYKIIRFYKLSGRCKLATMQWPRLFNITSASIFSKRSTDLLWVSLLDNISSTFSCFKQLPRFVYRDYLHRRSI